MHHDWNLKPAQARALQTKLGHDVRLEPLAGDPEWIAGVDVGFEDSGHTTRAAVVLMRLEDLTVAESAVARLPTTFPYVPGLLSFREAPAILQALEQLSQPPDLVMCDGQGIAHPRRVGIATHIGLLLDVPSIGIAKSRLVGDYDEPEDQKGAKAPLTEGATQLGAVVRTRVGTKPVFVSPGHRITINQAVDLVLRCTTKFKLPEPTRMADKLASRR